MEKETSHSVGGTRIFITLFQRIYAFEKKNLQEGGGGKHQLDQREYFINRDLISKCCVL